MPEVSKTGVVVYVPISIGELFDKITILEIKNECIVNEMALKNIRRELTYLREKLKTLGNIGAEAEEIFYDIKTVNQKLWIIEDEIRKKEKKQQFDNEFVELARSVYVVNDQRSSLKKRLNQIFGSEIIEEKCYENY